ncbi:MAG: iron chelate uptake ABC transporter family permease subunit, partial [Bosea sp. (in: a-proteobacteria)]
MTLTMRQGFEPCFESDSAPVLALAATRRRRIMLAFGIGALLCVAIALVALGRGPVAIAPERVVAILMARLTGEGDALAGRDALVVLNIRLPRVLLGLMIGAALAVSGALMQGLFRNPLADPGLVGVSAGAALAAAVTIVLGDRILAGTGLQLPVAA